MAEENKNVPEQSTTPEVTDRGLFDFLGKKKDEETKPEGTTLESDFEHQVKISEPAPEVKHEEEEKKPSLLEKLHRSDSSSSSSSEEEGSDGEKRKKKKKEKKKSETTTGEGEVKTEEEKKGFMEKLKEKLPGHAKKPEDGSPAVAPPPVVVAPVEEAHPAEKKGILEKIKEKLPGYHPKTAEDEKKEKTSG